MYLTNVLTYVMYLALCLLLLFLSLLILDFILELNYINDIMLKKIQTIVISLSLFATLIKFFIEIQEKYNNISDFYVLIIVFTILLSLSFLDIKHIKSNFKGTTKPQKRKNLNKKRRKK